ASPYDIVEYNPATISALMKASTTRTSVSITEAYRADTERPRPNGRGRSRFLRMKRLLLRDRDRRRSRRQRLWPDQDVRAVWRVLRHDVVVVGLPGDAVLDRAAGEDRVVPRRAHDRVVHLLLVDGAGLFDRAEEDPRGLPCAGLEPGGAALQTRRGPQIGELLDVVAGHQPIEPRRGDDVVALRLELVARLLLGSARPVGEVLVVQTQLRVLRLHRDHVADPRVHHERVGGGVLHAVQQAGVVLAREIERRGEHDRVAVGAGLRAVVDALQELVAVR